MMVMFQLQSSSHQRHCTEHTIIFEVKLYKRGPYLLAFQGNKVTLHLRVGQI